MRPNFDITRTLACSFNTSFQEGMKNLAATKQIHQTCLKSIITRANS